MASNTRGIKHHYYWKLVYLDRRAETEIERLRQDWTGLDLILTDALYTVYLLPREIGLGVWVGVPLWVCDSLL